MARRSSYSCLFPKSFSKFTRSNYDTVWQWFEEKPVLDHVEVFGTVGYAFIKPKQRKKWDPKATKVHLVGYEPTQKNFRLYEPISKKVIITCDVKFNENFIESKYVSLSSENDGNSVDQPGDQLETVKHDTDVEGIDSNEEKTLPGGNESSDDDG